MTKGATVLVVDDIQEDLRLLAELLAQEGFDVRVSTNGPDAIRAVEARPPNLVLLDIIMSGMDGFEVCRELKKRKDFASIPVIFISALGATEQKLDAFREGAVDYITKPFQPEEVIARVRTHLQLSRMDELKREVAERRLAESRLEGSLREKEALVKELFHRTRNTMQLVRSFIELEADDRQGNQELQDLVKETSLRIQAISLVHEMLYEGQDLSYVSSLGYLRGLAELFTDNLGLPKAGISLSLEAGDYHFLIDTAIPFGIILCELFWTSVTASFPSTAPGLIRLGLSKAENGDFRFSYSDNGTRLPDGYDFRSSGPLGLRLVFGIGEDQMRGKVSMASSGGFSCSFYFPDSIHVARV